jgi:hypothetical protein
MMRASWRNDTWQRSTCKTAHGRSCSAWRAHRSGSVIAERRCLRWRERRHQWRHASAGGFRAANYAVAPVAEQAAKLFVCTQHYSGSYPAARLRYGLYGERTGWLLGVAVLSVPVQASVLTRAFPGLVPYQESLELGRFVLLDRVPANAESWFLARVLAAAHRDHGLRGVVSFSDPLRRTTLDGRVVCPGHVGTIYQASNARYTGRSAAHTLWLLPDGRTLSPRALSKLRNGERGERYVAALVRGAGVPAQRAGEDSAAWLAQAQRAGVLRRVAHPGCHRYTFSLDRRRAQVALPALPYPKRTEREEG